MDDRPTTAEGGRSPTRPNQASAEFACLSESGASARIDGTQPAVTPAASPIDAPVGVPATGATIPLEVAKLMFDDTVGGFVNADPGGFPRPRLGRRIVRRDPRDAGGWMRRPGASLLPVA